MAATYEGGCYCGRVRYRAEAEPFHPHFCHCATCRRISGAPAVAWVNFRHDRFVWTAAEPAWFQSSANMRRSFCPECGSTLSIDEAADGWMCVAIASIDDPESVVPEDHVWTVSQLSWCDPQPGLPRYRRGRWEKQ